MKTMIIFHAIDMFVMIGFLSFSKYSHRHYHLMF